MDNLRMAFAYTKLNFQRCLYQGKTAVIGICIAAFLFAYFGDVRGALIQYGQKVNLSEMFLAVTNNLYTSFTIWVGFILIICDIPYRDEGVYQYLLRSSRKSWLWGQILYMTGITLVYFIYILLLLFLLLMPQIMWEKQWSNAFVRMINIPQIYAIKYFFSFPVSVIKSGALSVLFYRCIILCLLIGLSAGMLTMMFHLLWPGGPGIAVGGIGLALDYWTTVTYMGGAAKYLLYFSPFSLSRIGNLSSSTWNQVNPSFGYACCLMGVLIVLALIGMHLKIRRYDYQ